jgi:hypothetical protein
MQKTMTDAASRTLSREVIVYHTASSINVTGGANNKKNTAALSSCAPFVAAQTS